MLDEFEAEVVSDEAQQTTAVATVDATVVDVLPQTLPKDGIRAAVEVAGKSVVEHVKAFKVTPENLPVAGTFLGRIAQWIKLWHEHQDPRIADAMENKRQAEKKRKELVNETEAVEQPFVQAQKLLADAVYVVEQEVKQKAEAEQRRLQEASLKQAEEELLEAAIEAEAEAAQAETPEERAALEAVAEQILEQPVQTARVSVPAVSSGVTFTENWHWEWDEHGVKTLLESYFAGKLDKALTKELDARMDKVADILVPPLNIQARAMKKALKIPGGRACNCRKSGKGFR